MRVYFHFNEFCGRYLTKRNLVTVAATLTLSFLLTFASSNIAKAYCPPDDGCGTWSETSTVKTVQAYGSTMQVTYKFCHRINTCIGSSGIQIFLSEINYPDYPYSGDWSSFDLAYFYDLCVERLTDSALFYILPGFVMEGIPPCEEGAPVIVVQVGHHACVVNYSTFDTKIGATINVIGHCEMYASLFPDCQSDYSYCWEIAGYTPNPPGPPVPYYELKKTKTYSGPTTSVGIVPNPCPPPCEVTITNPDGSTYTQTFNATFVCE